MRKKCIIRTKKHRRQYTRDYKADAVSLVLSGRFVIEVSRDLGVDESNLNRCRNNQRVLPDSLSNNSIEGRKNSITILMEGSMLTTIIELVRQKCFVGAFPFKQPSMANADRSKRSTHSIPVRLMESTSDSFNTSDN